MRPLAGRARPGIGARVSQSGVCGVMQAEASAARARIGIRRGRACISHSPRSSRQRLPWGGWRALGVAVAGLLAAATSARAQDDPPGRVGRIAALQGEVWVYDDEQGEWQGAQHNRPLTQGDRLSTAAGARVELRIGSTTLQLGGGSRTRRRSAGRRAPAVCAAARQPRPAGALGARSRPNSRCSRPKAVSCPCAAGCTASTGRTRPALASVWRGELQFQAPELVAHAAAGPARRVLARRAAAHRAQPVAGRRWTTSSRRPCCATTRPTRAAPRTVFVSPEMTGVEDLDRYGGWQQHPEYGAVWTPTQVAVGWAPYRYGQWVWVRPWGWTWVDDAPWGFAPFHYGRWLSWGGRWCWAPGPRVARPVYAPALVAWVGGPQFNVVVGSRPVPAVGLGAAGAARGLSAGLPRQPRLPGSPEHASAACASAAAGPWQPRRSGRRDRAAGAAAGAAATRGGRRLARRRDGAAAPMAGRALSPRCRRDGRAYPVREATRPRAAVPLSPVPAGPAALQPDLPPQRGRPERADAASGAGACRHAAAGRCLRRRRPRSRRSRCHRQPPTRRPAACRRAASRQHRLPHVRPLPPAQAGAGGRAVLWHRAAVGGAPGAARTRARPCAGAAPQARRGGADRAVAGTVPRSVAAPPCGGADAAHPRRRAPGAAAGSPASRVPPRRSARRRTAPAAALRPRRDPWRRQRHVRSRPSPSPARATPSAASGAAHPNRASSNARGEGAATPPPARGAAT